MEPHAVVPPTVDVLFHDVDPRHGPVVATRTNLRHHCVLAIDTVPAEGAPRSTSLCEILCRRERLLSFQGNVGIALFARLARHADLSPDADPDADPDA